MNISSAIVKTLPENAEELIIYLKASNLCDIHAHEHGKIIITIEGESISEEIAKLREIERNPHVLSTEMIYSYSEYELEKEREKIEMATPLPDWLNNENLDARNIPYNGNLKKKF